MPLGKISTSHHKSLSHGLWKMTAAMVDMLSLHSHSCTVIMLLMRLALSIKLEDTITVLVAHQSTFVKIANHTKIALYQIATESIK